MRALAVCVLLCVVGGAVGDCLCAAPRLLTLDELAAACPLLPQCAALAPTTAGLVVLAERHLSGWPLAANLLCVSNATCGDDALLARTGALILAADEAAARTCAPNEAPYVPDPLGAPGVFRCVCMAGRRCVPAQPALWMYNIIAIVMAGFIVWWILDLLSRSSIKAA